MAPKTSHQRTNKVVFFECCKHTMCKIISLPTKKRAYHFKATFLMSKKNTFETEESKLSFFFYVPNLKKKQKFKTSVLPAQEPTKKKKRQIFPWWKKPQEKHAVPRELVVPRGFLRFNDGLHVWHVEHVGGGVGWGLGLGLGEVLPCWPRPRGVSLNGGFPPISHPKCWSFLVGKTPMGLLGKPTIFFSKPDNIWVVAFNFFG